MKLRLSKTSTFLLYTFLTKQEVCAMKPSGIGGQAVIEGIMMRNKDKYSIAVRKPDHEIEVTVRDCKLLTEKHKWMGYPIICLLYTSDAADEL